MPALKFLSAVRFAQSLILLNAVFPLIAQVPNEISHKPVPAKIENQILIFPDSVVTEQWPHTLKLVNPPQNLKLLNPGECIRIGVVAAGDDRDSVLEKTVLFFRVKFAGRKQEYALAPLTGSKQIKPESLDAAMLIAAATSVEVPEISTASLGASSGKWCVPDDAQDGIATIEAEAESPLGGQKLDTRIQIESFETGSKREFKDDSEIEGFVAKYYRQPNPARLIVLLRRFAADAKIQSTAGTPESTIAFLGAALKSDPTAANDFMTRVSSESGLTRAIGLIALRRAAYDTSAVLDKLSSQERTKLENLPLLPDPSDLAPDASSATRLDMLWGEFSATGALAPVQSITMRLAWRSDYDAFEKMIKIPNHPTEWTPLVAHATTYAAAGWALGSFQKTDPLVADYIEFLIASPDTPAAIKNELKGLQTNVAFQWQDKK